ncbi:Mce protein [Mycobacterium paraterrae]|uniref:Mce protein n=1 Tax=Mycobacterium paraterrae TaxID=577492 RepID=A0ABY3VRB6_9MYCO|nr:Mce protein [Mycobacterium paraterrae]UMB70044.1 Mce protein [Mycobacterium paraterrae]
MEGDAGTSQLTPNETDEDPSSEPDLATDDSTADETAEDSTESDAADKSDADASEDDPRGPSRLGRTWFIGIAAALAVLAGGVGTGGYFALRAHHQSQITARNDAAALDAAKDCVGATQAPDIGAMASAAQKIIECGAGAFRSQAILYSGLLVEAYQAANAHVQVSDLRAAVERNNPDGSVEILVPLRVKVSNAETQNQEAGYRLRVTMVREEGKYRIAKLDQVAR